MPPKNAQKGGGAASKKTEMKKKDKVIEDKTFGLKNKKGSKQQKFIQQVEKQVKSGGQRPNIDKERDEAQKKKDEKRKKMDELNDLFRPVQNLGSKGGDPKSILCAFYKQGQCGKGAKCKFSHDLGVERKAEKRSAFVDAREKDETSEDWDLDKLNDAIDKKHGSDNKKKQTTTEIVCKYFLDAVENGKYGWFWECQSGQTCKYRHALPPGFILKKDRKRMEKQTEEISLDDLIERERAALGHDTTRVTLETFLAWKKKKIKEREESAKKEQDKKKKKFDKGEAGLSGREMFTFNPELEGIMDDGDDAFDIRNMKREVEDGEEEAPEEHFKEIDMNALMSEMLNEKKDAGTVANPDRFNQYRTELAMEGKVIKEESGVSLSNGTSCEGAEGGGVDIDEDLFGGDDEDLDDLEEQLEDMNIN